LLEIDRVLPEPAILSGMLAFLAITVWLGLLAAEQFAWPRILGLGAVLAPAMAVIAFSATSLHGHPLASYGWLAWPLAFAVHVAFLARARGRLGVGGGLLVPFGYWILAGIAAVEAGWWTSRVAAGVWPSVAALGAVAVLVLVTLRLAALPGALGRQASCYVIGGAGGAALAAFVAMLILNFGSAGNAPPLPYVPLLNPLEIVSVVLVLTVARWHAVGGRDAAVMPARITLAPPVLVALYLLTMVVARTVHHWGAVPFDFDRLLESDTFQAALSIVWGTAGLAGMIVGAKRAVRSVWIAGAALMAIVVVKLFLVELDNSGTVERVVSFLGVGVLLLVVGYFAPVPPRARDASGAGDAVGAGDAASAARPGPAEA
jgi:uncharacterized membrane protein